MRLVENPFAKSLKRVNDWYYKDRAVRKELNFQRMLTER